MRINLKVKFLHIKMLQDISKCHFCLGNGVASEIEVYYKIVGPDSNMPFNDVGWKEATIKNTVPADASDFKEHTYEIESLEDFFSYFRSTWVNSKEKYWFEGAHPFGSSNNQGIEGQNRDIKASFTFIRFTTDATVKVWTVIIFGVLVAP